MFSIAAAGILPFNCHTGCSIAGMCGFWAKDLKKFSVNLERLVPDCKAYSLACSMMALSMVNVHFVVITRVFIKSNIRVIL